MQPYLKNLDLKNLDLKNLAISSVLLLLTACSNQPSLPIATENLEPNAQLWHWQAKGRIAFANATTNHSANLNWQQNGYAYQLQIFGPLGQGSARLEGEPFKVTLTTSDGQQVQASSPEQLLAEHSAWELPISNLVYWVRGIKAPGQLVQINSQTLVQNGWQVEWRRFTQVNDYQLPSLLVAKKGPLSFRLSINQWQLLPEPVTQKASNH